MQPESFPIGDNFPVFILDKVWGQEKAACYNCSMV